jgi:hypothetical protein
VTLAKEKRTLEKSKEKCIKKRRKGIGKCNRNEVDQGQEISKGKNVHPIICQTGSRNIALLCLGPQP